MKRCFLVERTLSPEEKIRRAEEIYYRRRNQEPRARATTATVSVNKERNVGLLKKMLLQIAICLVIYFIFYLVQNGNYLFSEDVIQKTKEVLSYDINIQQVGSQIGNFINEQMQGIVTSPKEEKQEDNKQEANEVQQENQIGNTNQDGVGGADLENTIMENTPVAGVQTQEPSQPAEPETDDEYIKNHFSLIKPLSGKITSEFGGRESTNPIVSNNHSGIDIGANTGTVIVAAMEGTVTLCSTTGDYGYHLKIENQDVATLYAHCSKMYVNTGDVIKQGQAIAEVGSTGRSTGPHLHFEIMRGSTYINPRNILEF